MASLIGAPLELIGSYSIPIQVLIYLVLSIVSIVSINVFNQLVINPPFRTTFDSTRTC
jgi:hypothetical protein